MTPVMTMIVGLVLVAIAAAVGSYGTILAKRGYDRLTAPPVPASAPPQAIGGRGGNASVAGSGIAVGGPGGSVAGSSGGGKGGDGGSASVAGDGIAAGGAGGSVDGVDIWYPPARSGYEIWMEQSGQKPDPILKQYGRGGMSSGYLTRFQVVEKIRQDYFSSKGATAESVDVNIHAVPLEYINGKLEEMKEPWRARITGADQYEFYIPR